jgi:two-component system sensor histidine kinase DegS
MNDTNDIDDAGDMVRPGTGSSDLASTYTRSSMKSGAVGISRDMPLTDAPAGDGPDTDTRVAMALLAAHEQERSRLAEELHDGPAQALANAIFQAEIIDRAVRDDPASARTEIIALRQMLERELDTLRGYINQLRPSLGEAAGLDDALRDSANAMSQRSGLLVDVRLEAPDDELHEAARTVVLRVAQEALRNISKHAGATRAWVHTFVASTTGIRRWVLEVGDDGRGFDLESVAANPNRRHFGLRFMRERSDLLGAQLTIQTSPAAGTVVRLTVDPGEERSQT